MESSPNFVRTKTEFDKYYLSEPQRHGELEVIIKLN